MSVRLGIVAVVLLCCLVPSFGADMQVPKLKLVVYEAWGFELHLPQGARKSVIASSDEIQLWELYALEDFVYFVKIARIPPNSLTSSIIEQDIQADSNLFTKRGATRRWEMSSEQGVLFKGLNHYARVQEDIPEVAVELTKVLRGRTACVSSAWAQLDDDTSPTLIVGVIGPKGRDGEVDALAKFLVHGFTRTNAERTHSTAEPSAVPQRPLPPPTPRTPSRAVPALSKGQIRIVGVVESIASEGTRLEMMAEEVATLGSEPVKLEPPRRKIVLLDKVPEGVAAKVRIVVIGPNSGVGVPIRAQYIAPAPH